RRVAGHLRDQEGRRVQVPQLLKELEDLVPRTLERREGVERVEAVERDQVAPHLLLVPGQLPTEPEEPPRLFPDLLDLPPQRAYVDHMDALRLAGILVRSLRQRWTPIHPREETARCDRLADDKMLSRQSPEDTCPTKTKIPEGHTEPSASSFGGWSRGNGIEARHVSRDKLL